jgi:hypothetical protein
VNQSDEVIVGEGSSKAESGFPAPEKAKSKAMPSDDGLGLKEDEGVSPAWPEAPEANPKQSFSRSEFGFTRLPF